MVVQRYRNVLEPAEGAVVLVYTADGDRGITYYATACLGCTYRADRDGSAKLDEHRAAGLANAHAATCRAMNCGVPGTSDGTEAAKIVRDRLWSLCQYGANQARYISLSDFHVDRVDLQRPADFIKETMLQLAQAEPDFVTTEPYSTGTGTRFLVQPHPRRS
ncbi:hypothetical protein [Streptomyces sp. NRRL S-1022]|uniref:hypothetical protein n=1 Tax=Streptomyces sp. NRRL S-1022 TaxID=1463880 RepID=UPI0004C285DC|nr:hypothetical protein [Streptomyces sp. NRRL S-1022]